MAATRSGTTNSHKYKAFGANRSSGDVYTDHGFTGQKQDDTGLLYYNARYYDKRLGAFISPDPLIPDAENVFASPFSPFSRIIRCDKSPLRFTTPTRRREHPAMTELPHKLTGQVALVTGAARGLGRAFALRLARLGADVVVNDIRLDAHREYNETLTAASVVDEIEALGVRGLGIAADVTDQDAVRALIGQITDAFGRLDILVNNAGGALFGQDFERTIDLNLLGTVYCCQAAAPVMQEQRRGRIVNVGSQAGLIGSSGGPYAVAKAGVIHYTRGLAAELGPYGVNVNCIAPGWILSSRAIAQGRAAPEMRAELESRIALRRLGEPEDCAKVVEFLVTDLSDYVTGQCIPVCGGYVLC